MADRQSSLPAPVIGSAPAGAMSVAVAISRALVEVADAPGEDCAELRSRASQPAAPGAAAEVPLNGEPKPPTPLTLTLSPAAHCTAWKVWLAAPACAGLPAVHGPATPLPPPHCVVVSSVAGPLLLKD